MELSITKCIRSSWRCQLLSMNSPCPPSQCVANLVHPCGTHRWVRTERGRFVELLGSRPKARILMEASTEGEGWCVGLIRLRGQWGYAANFCGKAASSKSTGLT